MANWLICLFALTAASAPEPDGLLYILVGVDLLLMTLAVVLIGILANSLRRKSRKNK
jgi:hypothetical protein